MLVDPRRLEARKQASFGDLERCACGRQRSRSVSLWIAALARERPSPTASQSIQVSWGRTSSSSSRPSSRSGPSTLRSRDSGGASNAGPETNSSSSQSAATSSSPANRTVPVQHEVGEQQSSLAPGKIALDPLACPLDLQSTAQLDAGRRLDRQRHTRVSPAGRRNESGDRKLVATRAQGTPPTLSSTSPRRADGEVNHEIGDADMTTTSTSQDPAARALDTVRNGVDTAALFGTLDAVKAQPALARFQFRARNRWIHGAHNRSSIQDLYGAGQEDTSRAEPFELDAGEPAVLLGTDTGPNPAEFLLHALAAA